MEPVDPTTRDVLALFLATLRQDAEFDADVAERLEAIVSSGKKPRPGDLLAAFGTKDEPER